MSYQYSDLRPALFTDEGQRAFLKFRDASKDLLDKAGAFRVQELISAVTGVSDSWLMLACIDRLAELGEIRKVDQGRVAGQHEVYVRAY